MIILAEPSVAWVDANVQTLVTKAVSKAYLEHLYSKQGQALAAKHFFRPRDMAAAAPADAARFAKLRLFTIEAVFGGWTRAHAEHFADGATFDQITAR